MMRFLSLFALYDLLESLIIFLINMGGSLFDLLIDCSDGMRERRL